MGEQLSTEQVLLLNNLMYMNNESPFNSLITTKGDQTLGEFFKDLNTDLIDVNKDYSSYIHGSEWKSMINAIKSDETLKNLQIVATNTDSGGGAGVLFVNPSTNEAIVTFRGTAGTEWKDNFIAGAGTAASDGVSSTQQENAIEWYQSLDLESYSSITVSGHSKGGNKAKYITVLDDSVDRCLSFDGQGFSDDFMKTYAEQIANNQSKIENNNLDYDFVNLLLNDIGNTTFYQGNNVNGFHENHCPDSFFQFEHDGSASMVPGERAGEMAALDEFLNNYIRSLPEEERKAALEMAGDFAQTAFNSSNPQDLIDILLSGNNVDNSAYLFAYLIEYQQKNPEFTGQIKSFLDKFGLSDVSNIIDTVTEVLDWKAFDFLLSGGGFLLDHLPGWLLDKLNDLLYDKLGIRLTREELAKLLGLVSGISDTIERIDIKDNGGDIVIKSKTPVSDASGKPCSFSVVIGIMEKNVQEFQDCGGSLEQFCDSVTGVKSQLTGSLQMMRPKLSVIESLLSNEAKACKSLSEDLKEITKLYLSAENRIISNTKL